MPRIRDHWASRLGFVFAAAGSAVGLGNLWKFPYITWHNNGGAFVLIYLVCVAAIGLPIMMSEILMGRRTQESPVPAFQILGNKWWGSVGFLGVLTGFVILGYYSVIAGWSIRSFVQCVGWSFNGYVAPPDTAFGDFLADAPMQLLLSVIFLLSTAVIIWRGVSKGIEQAAKILMPILLLIMAYLVIRVLFLPGLGQTMSFLFRPNFSELPPAGVLEALGHAFFTLSLGMGVMITYGSYMHKSESVFRSSLIVVFLDTLIALLACVIMYTIIFSVAGLEETVSGSTVGMLFVTLPRLFYTELSGGVLIGPLFYVLVAFAALTSTISLLEVIVSFFIDKVGIKRHTATMISCGIVLISMYFSALSLGAVGFLSNFELFAAKPGVLSTLDHLAANWMLPIGGLLTTIFVGWVVSKRISAEELGMLDASGNPTASFKLWQFFIRFIAPLAILAVIIAVIFGKDFS
ncbi:MAG: sodium-dependent transporter [candidate division Zixibacteria bacterium]|nr:sodium-dependent transporter [candidate division Zixibacteria bacterium]MBU1469883.1 sodium-dependent transporter [candidate division Zixibacteria bacterium]